MGLSVCLWTSLESPLHRLPAGIGTRVAVEQCYVRSRLLTVAVLANVCSSPKPDFKPLRARQVIDYTVSFVRKIPGDLYDQMLIHAK